jgi:hypothetical protein
MYFLKEVFAGLGRGVASSFYVNRNTVSLNRSFSFLRFIIIITFVLIIMFFVYVLARVCYRLVFSVIS